MEKFALTLQSAADINCHFAERHLMRYEQEIIGEILSVIEKGEADKLAWFAGFGDGYPQILQNVNEYRNGLEFGFTDIAFNQYGWFSSAKFLDTEVVKLEESSIRIGRGQNGVWAYALNCNYGTAGSSGPLCVFCKKYTCREAALTAALSEIKANMTGKAGHTDTSNYKQDLIAKTLKAITAQEIGLVQLRMF